MRRLAHVCLVLAALGNGAAALWALSRTPFAAPLVARSEAELRLAFERAMLREAAPERLIPRLEEAVAAGDRDRTEMLAAFARRRGVPIPPATAAAAHALLAPPGVLEQALDCGACAWNPETCDSLRQMAACALPVELTPAGDLNALRRQAANWLVGEEVDRIEAGLAVAGLGATALVAVSGGASYILKTGASAARLARRMGTLTPGLTRVLGEATDVPVAWNRVLPYLVGRAPLEEVADLSRLARVGAIAEDLGAVARHTSPVETLALLRHVDSAEDAARLRRLSAVAGAETRVTMELLGKARAFRMLVRLADIVLAAIGLVALFLAQVGSALVSLLVALLRRAVRPRPVARPRKPRHDRAAMGGGG
ncbi:MAG: hypothetical protein N2Z62_04595 [Rhodobacteraceae bacterium]|nr:hypothetical protein [Paracoccaceae bacterium]